jgi:putative ABC transport system ATP-binding protein
VSNTPPLLALEGLTKRYRADSAPVLERLELALAAGEYVAIMGESGAGKSTLLNLIAGLDRPDSGRVLFEGSDLALLNDDAITRLRRAHIGFVFQAFHVLPYLTVSRNVELPLDLLGVSPAQRPARVLQMLEACGIAPLAARYPRELSGGELQRVAIARALVHQPRLVLMDEPTGNLDARTAEQILRLLRAQLQASATGAILITHSMAAARTADRILLLSAGRLQAATSGIAAAPAAGAASPAERRA